MTALTPRAGTSKPETALAPREPATIEIGSDLPALRLSGDLGRDLEILRLGTQRSAGTALRRLLFVWLRIHVNERKQGSWERVDVRIPIPIPLIGTLLRRRLDGAGALRALDRAERDVDGAGALARQLDAFTGFELIRVEENKPERDKASLVVIGID